MGRLSQHIQYQFIHNRTSMMQRALLSVLLKQVLPIVMVALCNRADHYIFIL